MRRTGSEEIGFKQSPRPAGITSGVPRVLPLADFFGEAPELRPWIKEHDDAGRTLPGFIFAFVFYWLDLPTDCAIEPILFSRLVCNCPIQLGCKCRIDLNIVNVVLLEGLNLSTRLPFGEKINNERHFNRN